MEELNLASAEKPTEWEKVRERVLAGDQVLVPHTTEEVDRWLGRTTMATESIKDETVDTNHAEGEAHGAN